MLFLFLDVLSEPAGVLTGHDPRMAGQPQPMPYPQPGALPGGPSAVHQQPMQWAPNHSQAPQQPQQQQQQPLQQQPAQFGQPQFAQPGQPGQPFQQQQPPPVQAPGQVPPGHNTSSRNHSSFSYIERLRIYEEYGLE